MKYVMFRVKGPGGNDRLIPVVFPNALVHRDVAEALYPVIKGLPVSAGECVVLVDSTHGKSDTLSLNANEDDASVITGHDYLHGVIFD